MGTAVLERYKHRDTQTGCSHCCTQGEQPWPAVDIPPPAGISHAMGVQTPHRLGLPLLGRGAAARTAVALPPTTPGCSHLHSTAMLIQKGFKICRQLAILPRHSLVSLFDFSACSFNNSNVVKTPDLEPPFILLFPIFSKRQMFKMMYEP